MSDYNVLLIFFNNLERLRQTFTAIKNAKPKKLFLYQDGPRNANEVAAIMACREFIEENLDWECQVYKKYQEKNLGCDPSEYIAQTWAFSIVDKCIVLEDDDVPSPAFFEFCWELLLKYENDERIGMICGMNHFETYKKEYPYDYFFTTSGSIWGWASWRRVINSFDSKYSWLDDKNQLEVIRQNFSSKKKFDNFIKIATKRRNSGIEYYETILGVACMLNKQLNIVPTKNLISNIGAYGGTHTGKNHFVGLKKSKSLFNMPTYNYDFPLKHPNFIYEDVSYKVKVEKKISYNFFEKVLLKLKNLFIRNK